MSEKEKTEKEKKGMTGGRFGLYMGIALVGFVVVAAVFAYAASSTGFVSTGTFSTERSAEAAEIALPTLEKLVESPDGWTLHLSDGRKLDVSRGGCEIWPRYIECSFSRR